MRQYLENMQKVKLFALSMMLLSGFSAISFAQPYSNWFLVVDSVMSFTKKPPFLIKPNSNIIKYNGIWRSCISNCKGEVMLYSNPPRTFNQFGDSLGFYLINRDNYGAATNTFIPKPGNDSIYYHFYLVPGYYKDFGELRYTEINALANNGTGMLLKSKILVDDTCDRLNMCIIRNNDGTGFWVLVTYDSYTVNCYKIDQSGVSSKPVVNKNVYNLSQIDIGGKIYPFPSQPPNTYINTNQSYVLASNNGTKIVCTNIPEAVNSYAGNAFMYDFDQTTGKISNGKCILPVSELPVNYSSQGACFSGDDSLVYLSVNPSYNKPFSGTKTYKVIQYNIKSDKRKTIRSSNNAADALASMSLGDDGRLYGFSQTSYDIYSGGTVSIIHYPNKLGNACNIQKPQGFPRMDKILPTPADLLINIHTNLEYATCVDTVQFSVQGNSNFSKLTCHFGDGDSMVINSPQNIIYSFKHNYKNEGHFANLWEGRTKDCNSPVWYTDTLDVKFAPRSVSKSISFVQSPACSNTLLQFDDTLVQATVYQVNWGDDSIKAISVTGGKLTLKHTYLKPGNYAINVTVYNAWACSRDYIYTVKIDFLPNPKISMNTNAEQCASRILRLVNDSALDTDTIFCLYNNTQTLALDKNPINIPLQFGQDSIWIFARNQWGCSAEDTVVLNVKQAVNAAFSTSKKNYCVLETDTARRLFANPGDSSVWYWENTAYLFKHDFPLTATLPGTQTLVHSMKNPYGCSDTHSAVLEVYPLPDARFAGLQAKYCTGEKLQLVTSGTFPSDTMQWYINSIFQQQGDKFIQILNDTGKMNYKTIAVSQYGCEDSMTQATTVYMKPSPLFGISDTAVCRGDSIILTDLSNADSSAWQLDNMENTGKIWRLNFSAEPGKYKVMHIAANRSGCSDSAWSSIAVQNYPIADFTFTNSCQGQKIDFMDKSSGTVTGRYWLIQNKKYNDPTVSDTFKTDGSYPVFLKVNTTYGCTDSITKEVQIYPKPKPTIYFTGSSYKEPSQFNYYLEASPDTFTKYNWTLGSAGNSDKAKVYVTFYRSNMEEAIHLEVHDNRNCLGYTDTIIKVLGLTGYYFPNSFTPNNDKINDGFGVAGPEYIKTYKLRIFNRWGEKVFYTENPYQLWEPENPVPGEYIYKAVVQDIYGRWKEMDGIVILIR